MKTTEIRESGIVDSDGRMRLPMDRLNAFFAAHKGERIVITVQAMQHGTSAAQRGYYYTYVLPTIVDAYRQYGNWLTPDDVDQQLVGLFPVSCSTAEHPVNRASDMTMEQMTEFLEWLKEFAAENLYVYVEDPKTI